MNNEIHRLVNLNTKSIKWNRKVRRNTGLVNSKEIRLKERLGESSKAAAYSMSTDEVLKGIQKLLFYKNCRLKIKRKKQVLKIGSRIETELSRI